MDKDGILKDLQAGLQHGVQRMDALHGGVQLHIPSGIQFKGVLGQIKKLRNGNVLFHHQQGAVLRNLPGGNPSRYKKGKPLEAGGQMHQFVRTEQIEIGGQKRPVLLIEPNSLQPCRVCIRKQGNMLINCTKSVVKKLHI